MPRGWRSAQCSSRGTSTRPLFRSLHSPNKGASLSTSAPPSVAASFAAGRDSSRVLGILQVDSPALRGDLDPMALDPSLTDPVTGLANRRALLAELRRRVPSGEGALVLLDLDFFRGT